MRTKSPPRALPVLAALWAAGVMLAGTYGSPGPGPALVVLLLALGAGVRRRPLAAPLLLGGFVLGGAAGAPRPLPAIPSGGRADLRVEGRVDALGALDGERSAVVVLADHVAGRPIPPRPVVLALRDAQRLLLGDRVLARVPGRALQARGATPARAVVVAPSTSAVFRLRGAVHAAIDRHLAPGPAGLVRAFATGDRSRLPAAVRADFARSGLSHLLAVSGLNLTLIAGVTALLLARLLLLVPHTAGPGADRLGALATLPLVGAYAVFVGASPSAVRAALMFAALLLARIFRRAKEVWSSLAMAFLLMVGHQPEVLLDVSFQLSFAAVAALVALDRLLPRGPRGLLGMPLEVLRVSALATLGTAPIVAHHFGQLSLAGLLANVPAHPLSSFVLVPFSLLGGLLALVHDPLGGALLQAAGWAAAALGALARWTGALPGAALAVPPPTPGQLLLLGLAVALLALAERRRWALIPLAAALVVELALRLAPYLRAGLTATALSVGQGDAILLELPRGQAALIDTGPDPGARALLRALAERRIGRLDRVVLTHPHVDHTGGLAALAERVEIGELWWNGDRRDAPPWALAPLARLPARVVTATCPPDQWAGVAVRVLGPRRPAARYPVVNDASLVLRLQLGRRALLFAGDAERAAEEELVSAGGLTADVLKVGHHGSKTSSSEAFLRAVRPRELLVSLGADNRFGFPHAQALARLEATGARLWRTDLDGAVQVWTDGQALAVEAR